MESLIKEMSSIQYRTNPGDLARFRSRSNDDPVVHETELTFRTSDDPILSAFFGRANREHLLKMIKVVLAKNMKIKWNPKAGNQMTENELVQLMQNQYSLLIQSGSRVGGHVPMMVNGKPALPTAAVIIARLNAQVVNEYQGQGLANYLMYKKHMNNLLGPKPLTTYPQISRIRKAGILIDKRNTGII